MPSSGSPVLEFGRYNNGWDTTWVPAASGVQYRPKDLPIAEQLYLTWEELKAAVATFDPDHPPGFDVPDGWN